MTRETRTAQVKMSKRRFLQLSGASAAVATLGSSAVRAEPESKAPLQPIVDDVEPISVSERIERVQKAQRLMAQHDIDAILVEPGSAMLYFSGISWWRSERQRERSYR